MTNSFMTARTRRIVLQAVVVLGAVVPFVIGAVSQSLSPGICRRSATVDSAGSQIDDQDVWYGFGTMGAPVDRAGIKYRLDYQHALADAKLSKRPVFLYFTSINDVNSRQIDRKVLHAPAVIARLRRFECAALFVDSVPCADRTETNRLVAQNGKLRDELVGDAHVPAFAIVQPDFDAAVDPEKRQPLATADIWEISDQETAGRILDEALVKWAKSQSVEK